MKILQKLLESWSSVFTIPELKQLLGKRNSTYINLVLQPLKTKGILKNIHYGIWAFKEYDVYELASKVKSSSYISFETVLQKNNIIFQHYHNTITLASINTVEKHIDWYTFSYHKIKDSILMNPLGIQNMGKYMIASPERALCDMVYLYKNIVFDNIESLQIDLLKEISTIYPKSTNLAINKLLDVR